MIHASNLVRTRYPGKIESRIKSPLFNNVALQDRPLGAWYFDTTSGDVIDLSGNNNTAIANGNIIYQQSSFNINRKSVSTNYIDGYDFFYIGHPEWRTLKKQTYEAIIKPLSFPPSTNPASADNIYSIIVSQGYHQGLFYSNSKKFQIDIWRPTLTQVRVSSTNNFEPNNWYHVIGVADYSNGNLSLYVNGTLEGSTTFPSGETSTNSGYDSTYRIGTAYTSNISYSNPSHMSFDWVAFYDKSFTNLDVQNHYQAYINNP